MRSFDYSRLYNKVWGANMQFNCVICSPSVNAYGGAFYMLEVKKCSPMQMHLTPYARFNDIFYIKSIPLKGVNSEIRNTQSQLKI